MGIANSDWKTGSVPSLPGNTKSYRDQSSIRLFWIGVPNNYNIKSKYNKLKIKNVPDKIIR